MSERKWQPSLRDLMAEIRRDLPDLFKENPNGLSIPYLSSWYGESTQRIMKAVKGLEEKEKLHVRQAANKTFYIVPWDYEDDGMADLTELQRKLVRFVWLTIKNGQSDSLKTNYSQLSRLLKSSYGGMVLRVQRCVDLGYLTIDHPSLQGRADTLILRMGHNFKPKYGP